MSRAFVREVDESAETILPDRPVSPLPNIVTRRGLALIEAQLEQARSAVAAARESGDAAAIAEASRDLRYWTSRRSSAELSSPSSPSTHVQFGSRVTLRRADGRVTAYRIVGIDEADPPHGLISYAAPLARALVALQKGDTVDLQGQEAEILSVEQPED
jgi:transcription elongation GreA/GreB family factor